MTSIRPFQATDILRFNTVNADPWTATYHTGYYATYAATWPDFCVTAEHAPASCRNGNAEASSSKGGIHAYKLMIVIAKHEPPPPDTQHHGHLTALSICPSARGTGLARVLMDILESLSGPKIPYDHAKPSANGTDTATDNSKAPDKLKGKADAVDAWFVDLFVRCNNKRAEEMYEKLGYSVYRRVVDYYQGMKDVGNTRDELDGYDMRKSMAKDRAKRYVRANGRDILVSPEQVWA